MRPRAYRFLCAVLLALLLASLSGCAISIRRIGSTPTPLPPAPPGTACSVISLASLQAWIDQRLPRMEEELIGGVVYLDSPHLTNCVENSAEYVIRIGYERSGVAVELSLLESDLDLLYDSARGEVCVDVQGLISSEPLSPQGVEQVGQEIRVAEARAAVESSARQMPAEVQQEVERALDAAAIQGDPQVEGIGTDAAGLLLRWVVDQLLERFNEEFARLVGACLPAE